MRNRVRSFVAKEGLSFPILLATQEVAGIYNIIYRYLFDRRRDLALPTSFLINGDGMIVKVYQGPLNPERLTDDLKSAPESAAARMRRALPFEGTLYQDQFQRNDFTYGVAMFQRGYLDQAAASFQQVIAAKPQEPEAYYNLGTLYLRKNALAERAALSRADGEAASRLSGSVEQSWNGRRPGRQAGRGHPQLPAVLVPAAWLCHCAAEPRKPLSAAGSV